MTKGTNIAKRSFATYIRRVLRQVHPDSGISLAAMDTIDSCLGLFAHRMAEKAGVLAKAAGNRTVSSREVQTVVRLFLPGMLSKHAVSEGTKAVCKTSTSIGQSQSRRPISRSARAGLQFPVSLCEAYLRDACGGMNVGAGASVYLAAVLEYLTAEICELTGNVTRAKKRVRITNRDIFNAMSTDDELNKLFTDNKILIIGGGVMPHIDNALVVKNKEASKRHKPASSKTKKTEGDTGDAGDATGRKPHRYRPGTVALRQIRKQQNMSGELRFFNTNFREACKNIAHDYVCDVSFSPATINTLQHIIEHEVVELYRKAYDITRHSEKTTLSVKDIVFAAGEGYKPQYPYGNSHGVKFSKPAFDDLAKRAGVFRCENSVWGVVRQYVVKRLEYYLESAVWIMQHNRNSILSVKHLHDSLKLNDDIHVAIVVRKGHRSKKTPQAAPAPVPETVGPKYAKSHSKRE